MNRVVARVARGVVLAIVLLVASAFAGPASAAPPEPTLTLTQLRAELAAAPGGTLPGYFKTVLRGATIERIPADVQAVTGGPADELDPDESLILFEAKGPVIDRLGGIASGMSGSPVYVTVRGVDYLVGALSYGDIFTIGGSGLATPIEAMIEVEQQAITRTLPLETPVITSSGVKNRVVIGTDEDAARLVAATGGVAVKPLTALYVGGINPKSAPYRTFKELAERSGVDVVPLAAPLSTGNQRFTTDFVPGAALAALGSRGDLWLGSIGTVTYVNGGKLLAFGHPFTRDGKTSLYLHNAWIDGVWPSQWAPYKLGTPGALRGAIIEDRDAGIMGITSATPEEALVTSYARRSDTGQTRVSRVAVTTHVMDSTMKMWQGIAPLAAAVAPLDVYRSDIAPGSAFTTTTVVVTNGTETFSVVRENVFHDGWSIPQDCTTDVYTMVGQLINFGAQDIEDIRIVSIDLTSTISASPRAGFVVDVSVPGGLHIGENTVRVGMRYSGFAETRTVDVTMTLPPGTPLDGELTAKAAYDPYSEDDPMWDENLDPASLADTVRLLNEGPTNDQLLVSYSTGGGTSLDDLLEELFEAPTAAPMKSIEATAKVGYALSGKIKKQATQMRVRVSPSRPTFGDDLFVAGTVEGASNGDVEIWGRAYGETMEQLVATATLLPLGESAAFSAMLPLESTTALRVSYLGDSNTLNAEKSLTVPVKTRVGLSASTRTPRRGTAINLTAIVSPRSFGGSVVFERFDGRRWRHIATKSASSGVATARFTPPSAVTKVRARTAGAPSLAAGTSSTVIIRTR